MTAENPIKPPEKKPGRGWLSETDRCAARFRNPANASLEGWGCEKTLSYFESQGFFGTGISEWSIVSPGVFLQMKCLLCFFPEFCWEDVWNVKTPRSQGVLDLVPPSKSEFRIFVPTFDDRTWVKVEDMTSFTEKSKVADSRRPGTSALLPSPLNRWNNCPTMLKCTSDSNFSSKHTNLPQKLQELSWQICYFLEIHLTRNSSFMVLSVHCLGKTLFCPSFFSNKKRGWTLDQMDVVRQGWSRKLWKSLRRTALWWSVWYGCPGRFFGGSLVMWKITKRFQDLKK